MKNQYLISSSFLAAAFLSVLPHFSKDKTVVINTPATTTIISAPKALRPKLKNDDEWKTHTGTFALPTEVDLPSKADSATKENK